MENSEKFNEESALKVISAMIEAARSDVRDNHFFYLLWGFLVLGASLLEYCLITFAKYPHHYIGWPVLMGAGMIVSLVYATRKYRRSDSSTYVGGFFKYFFLAWSISLLLLLGFIIPGENQLVQPIILAMYALATFVSGGILRFKPLIWGGIIAWAAAIASFFSPFPVQLLITAATVVIAYIIPGFLLKRRNGNQITVN
ncbi:MAG: hypothetical protein H6Q21_1878 [Bacteroidetes bacterium]|jgi:hypothetical protein|nr:hypothetical protein [Bacteroidota bacterium]